MFCITNLSDSLGAREENVKTMNLFYDVFKSKVIHHN